MFTVLYSTVGPWGLPRSSTHLYSTASISDTRRRADVAAPTPDTVHREHTDGTGDAPDATRTRHDTRKGRVWPICLVKKINKSIDRSKASVHRQETGIKARCLVRSSETKGGLRGWQPEGTGHAPGRGYASPARVIPGSQARLTGGWAKTFRSRSCHQLLGLFALAETLYPVSFEGETKYTWKLDFIISFMLLNVHEVNVL